MNLYSVLTFTFTIITALLLERALGSGLRADVHGSDDALLGDINSLDMDMAFDNDTELNLDLVDNSASNEQDHRFLQSCPAGCKPNGQSFTQVYKSGSFTRGPYTVPWGRKKSTLVVGGMCHSGCRRLNAVVTSKNRDAVACGKFNAAYHDASPAKWLKPYDSKDCRLNIPYCEHAWSKGTCVYKIYEKCDPL